MLGSKDKSQAASSESCKHSVSIRDDTFELSSQHTDTTIDNRNLQKDETCKRSDKRAFLPRILDARMLNKTVRVCI